MDNDFGKIVLDARKEAGLTQEELAKLASISKSYVGTIENTRPHTLTGALPRPNRDKIIRVVNVINSRLPFSNRLDLDELLQMVGHAPTEVVETPGFFKGLDKLSPERQDLAKRQIRAIIDSLAEQEHDTDYIDDED